MAYYSDAELKSMGFKFLGKNVKISNKASIYNCDQISISDNSRIDDFCVISGKVTIGKFVHIAPFCLMAGGYFGITMNDFSGLAYHVQIFSQSDDYSGATLTNPTVPSIYKSEIKSAVHLGRHVIVGAGSIVFPGVNIAEGCSVGAMSLVHKSTDPWGIYLGNPARRVKNRKKDLILLEKKLLQEMGSDSI
ncbi:acyltransferase [Comamonas aquatica]|uniref:acyltransferase n=1 Tax=Comamonas aquatica TaxID=225991 RepID=UPI00244C542C|nr:acyltransferase [Comamonas aquatica]MDH0382063.1 acyltransferase [Comamonas aquatica]MDH0430316.1 acyltransferase [Comamonas aquatica]MDH0941182.1 acyltransferase [Comamonas aquatica]